MQRKYYYFLVSFLCLVPSVAQAQPIIPAADGTGTVVTPDGTRYDITGGQTSADGANLFHSFTQFGLEQNQTANFLSNPTIQNILTRVNSGNPSVIDGLIQVTGGNSNLFLMNPAGIVFGQNARLDVPGAFTATTATGIGLGNQLFTATEPNNYATLVGTPSAFEFSTIGTPGAIVNAGQLSVANGQNLSLLGGSVVSMGSLNAPGRQINVATVPGQSLLRITQTGHLLSLEISPSDAPLTPLSLPQLLTGSGQNTGIVVNGTGQAELAASGLPIESGDIVANQVTSQTATLSAQNNLSLVESTLQTTGDLNLLAQDTVRVRDSVANPFIAKTGGNLYVEGIQGIDILALNHPETPFQSGGSLSLVSDGIISGDAHFKSGGSFSVLNRKGGFGNFYSLYDPIIDSATDVNLGEYTGVALKVISGGSIIGGNITITGPDSTGAIPADEPDFVTLTSTPSLIMNAAGSIDVGNIDTFNQGLGDAGLVRLAAVNDITTGNITTNDQGPGNAGSVTITSTQGNIAVGDIDTSERGPGDSGTVALTAGGNITYGTIDQSEQGPGNQAGLPTITPNSPGTDPDPDPGTDPVTNPNPNPDPDPPPPIDPSQSLSISPLLVSDFVQLPEQPATHQALGQLPSVTLDPIVAQVEQTFTSAYQNYMGQSNTNNFSSQIVSLPETQSLLQQIEKAASIKPALIYAFFVPTSLPSQTPAAGTSCNPNPVGASCPTPVQQGNLQQSAPPTANLKSQSEKSYEPHQILWQFNSSGLSTSTKLTSAQPDPPQDNDQLELVLVTSSGKPIQRRVTGATRKKVLEMVGKLRAEITNPIKQRTTSYLVPAQQLYQWLVTPLEKELQAQQINNLVFLMDAGLRSLPLAVLHDHSGFIVERYSVGLMPSVSLTDTRYVNVKNTQVLAMGASTFTEQDPLPAASAELSVIAEQLWSGESFLNDAFTRDNLKGARATQPFGIIHLATHASFEPGKPSDSYIQLWGDDKLRLDQLRQLGWNDPPVELLVLSACSTALGDEEAELGFTGLATLSGVKTALGSLWTVSDEGTFGLMSEFYEQLKQAPIKAEALRQAQLAMIQGTVRLEGGKLITSRGSFPLPPELAQQGDKILSHPYFWSGFSMIGNPW